MVAIASKLPTAVCLDISPFEFVSPGVWAPRSGNAVTSVTIAGRNTGQQVNQIKGTAPAITDVDADFWTAWKAANASSDLLTGGWLTET